jgi:hypothetical protein
VFSHNVSSWFSVALDIFLFLDFLIIGSFVLYHLVRTLFFRPW